MGQNDTTDLLFPSFDKSKMQNNDIDENEIKLQQQKSMKFYSVLQAKEDIWSLYNRSVLKKLIGGKFRFYN